ncbi:hypothetical protein IC617_08800 [Neiella sp. HB171785]|uniref:Uncharacterized protein n=1 Tax=Neiella litorisoli TaxID=2771431 RepID=A0A8J6QH78_9GAMM|nr:hypothetical protein [Neiella litorisoli]MBD1389525.1 hypothetical protein [Neiella litorisoli]
MADVSDAVDEVINVLEARFSSSEDQKELVLKSLMLATTGALMATENDECGMVFDDYKSTFSVEKLSEQD